MRLRTLFLGSFALASMLFAQSCGEKNDEPMGAPSIELSASSLDFGKDSDSQTIQITATRDWTAKPGADWIAVEPASGNGSSKAQNVTVTVLSNEGLDRQGTVELTIGFDSKTLTVNQSGAGSASYTSISDVRAKGAGATLGENTVICGTIISNSSLSNFTSNKIIVLQDETAGIEIFLSDKHSFARGDKVIADLSGAALSEYAGLLQINGLALDKVTKVSSGNEVAAKTVSIDDFLANKYESQYVAIENVQVADADLSKTWVQNDAHSSINLISKEGKNIIVRSSKYSSYKAETVPQGSGTIKGISAIFNSDMQLIFSDASDYAGLTGERFKVEVSATDMTVAEVAAAANNTAVNIKGLVTGAYKNGFILTDATGSILIFEKNKCSAKVGDKVKVSGSKTVYSNLAQVASSDAQPLSVEVESSDNEVSYPSAKVLEGAALDSYSATTNELISYTGVLVKDGNYYNVQVAGATRKGSLQYIPDSFGAASLEGAQVEVTGYFTGLASSSSIVNTLVTSLKASSASYLSVSPLALSAKADDVSASFDIKANVDWTVSSDNAKYTVSDASGNGDKTVTVSFAANTAESDVTVKLTVSTTADVATKSYTVVLTHKGTAVVDYNSNITWTAEETTNKSYNVKVKINGDSEQYEALKLGTSSVSGAATMVIPAGTKKITFYAYAWKGKNSKLSFKVGDKSIGEEIALKANAGCNNNTPFSLTDVAASDLYAIDVTALNGGNALASDVTVTVASVKGNDCRAVIFAINAVK